MIVMKSKKIIGIVIALVVTLSLGGLFYYGSICRTDGSNVCYDANLGQFQLEDNVELKVAVETEATKLQLEKIWNDLYPEQPIQIDIIEAMTRVELSEPIAYDVYFVEGSEALYFMHQFANLGQRAQAVITKDIPIGLQDSYNINGLRFVPQNVIGKKLYINMSLLESMDLTLEDVASFEKIKEHEEIILQTMDISFPFSFKDHSTFYPFLTAGGWTMNFTHEGMNPNIDSEQFLASMEFFEFMSTMKLVDTDSDLSAHDLPYTFEEQFFKRKSLFGYISDEELAAQYRSLTDDVWKEIPFPTYKELHLAQEVDVRGYVVHSETVNPSASAEVLRILRLPDFLELGDAKRYPIYQSTDEDAFELSDELKNRVEPFIYGDLPSILALDVEPRVRAIQIYQDVDFIEVTSKVFDGILTPEEGQAELLELANQWLAQFTPEEEGTE